jgi:trk system potassium uptake protein
MSLLRHRFARRLRRINLSPPAILVLGYALLVFFGAVALKLPFMSVQPLTWSDVIFTSASAVTVTGLVVVDTGSHFSIYGQGVILLLIQLGGLGLMTTAVFVFSVLGMRLPFRQQLILSEDLNQTDLGGLLRLAASILRIVLVVEVIGAAFLAVRFIPELGWSAGLWSALFHSISAFNNAGFGLHADSLSRWVADPVVNVVVPLLFILGGLGFTVILDVYAKRNWKRLELHSKLMLSGTMILIVWSFVAFLMLEWNNPKTLATLPHATERVWASWFQAVTTRTAGFNTVDISALRESTALLIISLMLIGGGTTSTAGGLKVTTFMVLILATHAFLRRKDQITIFSRNIPTDQILKVLALVTLCIMILLTATFVVLVSSGLPFLNVLFEVASAFGTVGLSRGITAELDSLSRIVIVFVMFAGRVGPLLLGFFIATAYTTRVRYPSSTVYLG